MYLNYNKLPWILFSVQEIISLWCFSSTFVSEWLDQRGQNKQKCVLCISHIQQVPLCCSLMLSETRRELRSQLPGFQPIKSDCFLALGQSRASRAPASPLLLFLLFLLLEILIVVDKTHGQSGRNCRCVHRLRAAVERFTLRNNVLQEETILFHRLIGLDLLCQSDLNRQFIRSAYFGLRFFSFFYLSPDISLFYCTSHVNIGLY